MKLPKLFHNSRTDIRQQLSDYTLRALNLYDRDRELQSRFSSPQSPEFSKFIDTDAILHHREIQEVGVPFPPWQEMLTVGGETDLRLFLAIGYECYEAVRAQIPSTVQPPIKILDFGVGCGRTMRFFYRELDKFDCHGCDVDSRSIAYLKNKLPFIRAKLNSNSPPLPYASNQFDIIYSISVFTHLNLTAFKSWIVELARVLRPRGRLQLTLHGHVAFVTVSGDPTKRNLLGIAEGEFTNAEVIFNRDGFLWVNQPAGSDEIDSSQFGISFISPDRLNELVSDAFEVLEYQDGKIGGWQDFVVLEKKSP